MSWGANVREFELWDFGSRRDDIGYPPIWRHLDLSENAVSSENLVTVFACLPGCRRRR